MRVLSAATLILSIAFGAAYAFDSTTEGVADGRGGSSKREASSRVFATPEEAFVILQREQKSVVNSALLEAMARRRSETAGLSEIRNADDKVIRIRHPWSGERRHQEVLDAIPLERVMELLSLDEVLVFVVPAASGGHFFAITNDYGLYLPLPPDSSAGRWGSDLRCEAAARLDSACHQALAATEARSSSVEARGAASLASAPAFDFQLAYNAYDRLFPQEARKFLQSRSSLIVVSSKELLGLPWHLLVTAPPGSWSSEGLGLYKEAPWLFRGFESITVLPSISSLEELRNERWVRSLIGDSYIGIGDPVIGRTEFERQAAPRDCRHDATGAAPLSVGEPEKRAFVPPSVVISANRSDGKGAGIDLELLRRQPRLADTYCEIEEATLAISWQLISAPSRKLTRLRGPDATERKLKELNDSRQLAEYRVIHLATHGLIGGQLGVGQSGLILTPPDKATGVDDGILTAEEIAAMRLTADTVILSACSTAAGASQGAEPLSGLASAFFVAGARSVLVSSWPVYSPAAKELITRMINSMTGANGGPRQGGEALTVAMTQMLGAAENDFTAHPAYWAPFLLIGDAVPEEGMILESDDVERPNGIR